MPEINDTILAHLHIDHRGELPETSGNLGVLSIRDGQFTASALVCSALDSEGDAEAQRFAEVFAQAGATVELTGTYSGWPHNPDSPLLALMQQVYADVFGTAPMVTALHAGLENTVAGVKIPGLDMISVGPTVEDVHSPDERLDVASVPKVYVLLVASLRQVNYERMGARSSASCASTGKGWPACGRDAQTSLPALSALIAETLRSSRQCIRIEPSPATGGGEAKQNTTSGTAADALSPQEARRPEMEPRSDGIE